MKRYGEVNEENKQRLQDEQDQYFQAYKEKFIK